MHKGRKAVKGPSGSNYGSFGYVVVGAVVLIAFFRYIHGFVSQPRLNHAAINAVMDKCEPSSVPARAKVGGRDIFVCRTASRKGFWFYSTDALASPPVFFIAQRDEK